MGLDGLSVKNLGLNRENTSKENAIEADALANSRSLHSKNIDQLDKKQALTAEDHDNPSFSGGFTEDENEIEDVYESEAENDSEDELVIEDYIFKIDNEKNLIQVFDGETNRPVLEFTAEKLSKFVSHLRQSSGIIVNKKV